LRDTCHWTYPFQPVDGLIGFVASFITKNISHHLGMFLGGLRLQDLPVEEVATKFGLVVVQRCCLVSSFSINKGGPGSMWERSLPVQPADLRGADVMLSLFLPHQEPELLEKVILHKVWGKENLAHMEFPAMLLCMLHALGLEGIECFQVWAKGIPVKVREGCLREEGMKHGKQEVALGGFQEEKVVGVLGGRDRACKPLHLKPDDLQPWFAN